jgi:hypothetical protein
MLEELDDVRVIEGTRTAFPALHHILEHLLRHYARQHLEARYAVEISLNIVQALFLQRFHLPLVEILHRLKASTCFGFFHRPTRSFGSFPSFFFYSLPRKICQRNKKKIEDYAHMKARSPFSLRSSVARFGKSSPPRPLAHLLAYRYAVGKVENRMRFTSTSLRKSNGRPEDGAVVGGAEEPGLAIYVHWPYCSRICPYCDFNRYLADKGGNGIDHQRMAKSYKRELATFRQFLDEGDHALFDSGPTGKLAPAMADHSKRRKVASVFFGGGTPSLAKVLSDSFVLNCELFI